MIEALIVAGPYIAVSADEKRCAKQVDIKPDKVLWPMGYVFKEWLDEPGTTSLPRWMFWEVIGEVETWRGPGQYERMNEIKRFWFMDFRS
jgi:hypothetical protein